MTDVYTRKSYVILGVFVSRTLHWHCLHIQFNVLFFHRTKDLYVYNDHEKKLGKPV